MVGIEYCEKAAFSGFFEPLNFLSNFFIIIAGIFILLYMRKHKINDWVSRVFVVLVFLIGIGSMSWHFYQIGITLFLDIFPIFILVFMTIFIALNQITNNKIVSSLVLIITFALVGIFGRLFMVLFGVSQSNGPPFLGIIPALLFLLIFIYVKSREKFKRAIFVVLFFGIAIFFRQIDLIVCNYIPFGTHLLWHFFNSFALYFMFLWIREKKVR